MSEALTVARSSSYPLHMQSIPEVSSDYLQQMLKAIGESGITLDMNSAETPIQLAELAVKQLEVEAPVGHVIALRTLLLFMVVGARRSELEAAGLFQGNAAAVAIHPALHAAVGQAPFAVSESGFVFDADAVLGVAVKTQHQIHM